MRANPQCLLRLPFTFAICAFFSEPDNRGRSILLYILMPRYHKHLLSIFHHPPTRSIKSPILSQLVDRESRGWYSLSLTRYIPGICLISTADVYVKRRIHGLSSVRCTQKKCSQSIEIDVAHPEISAAQTRFRTTHPCQRNASF